MKYTINLTVELKEGTTFKKLMDEIAHLKLTNALVLESTATNTDEPKSKSIPPFTPKPKKV